MNVAVRGTGVSAGSRPRAAPNASRAAENAFPHENKKISQDFVRTRPWDIIAYPQRDLNPCYRRERAAS